MALTVEEVGEDPRGPLLAAWEEAFVAPAVWREKLAAGMIAMVELLERDPEIAKTCVLSRLPVTTGGALVWHRELVRARVVEVMHREWETCGGQHVPPLHFEVLVGEACTLLRHRRETGDSYADLPAQILALWGDRGAVPDVRVIPTAFGGAPKATAESLA